MPGRIYFVFVYIIFIITVIMPNHSFADVKKDYCNSGTGFKADEYRCYAVDSSGNTIFVYNKDINDEMNQLCLLKINSQGETVWEKVFKDEEELKKKNRKNYSIVYYPLNIKIDRNGDIYLTLDSGNDGFDILYKFDQDGNFIWKKMMDDYLSYSLHAKNMIIDIDEENQPSVCFGLFARSDRKYLLRSIKFTEQGDTLWIYDHEIKAQYGKNHGIKISHDDSNHTYVLGYVHDESNQVMVVKIDPSGNLLWEYVYDGDFQGNDVPYDIIAGDSVLYVLTGEEKEEGEYGAVLLSIDSQKGELLWKSTLDTKLRQYISGGFLQKGEDGLYCVIDDLGTTEFDFLTYGPVELIKCDFQGNELWKREIDKEGFMKNDITDFQLDRKGNLLLFGYYFKDYNARTRYTSICKYDPQGNKLWEHEYNNQKNIYSLRDTTGIVSITNDNSILIMGIKLNCYRYYENYVIKFDEHGNVVWENYKEKQNKTGRVKNGLLYSHPLGEVMVIFDYGENTTFYRYELTNPYTTNPEGFYHGGKIVSSLSMITTQKEGAFCAVGNTDPSAIHGLYSQGDYFSTCRQFKYEDQSKEHELVGVSFSGTDSCYIFGNSSSQQGLGSVFALRFKLRIHHDGPDLNWFREYVSPEGGDCYCGAGLTDWRGHLIMLGREERSGENELLFLRYDSTGTLLKDLKQGTGERKLFPVQGESTKDHRFKALCRYEEGIEKGVLTFCLDEEGNIQESLELSGHWEEKGYLKMFQSSEEDIFIAGQSGEKARVAKVSSLGAEMWSKEYDMSGKESLTDARMDSFGNLYLLLNGEIGEKKRTSILKLDGEGEVLWNQTCLDSFPYDVHGLTICLNNEDNLMVFGKLSKGEEWDIAYLLQYSQTGTPVLESYPKESREGEKSFVRYYPNPFYDRLTIEMDLGISEDVDIRLYNLLGQEIEKIYQGWLPAGKQIIHWRSERRLSSGIYFMKVKMGENEIIKKITYLK